MTARSRQPSVSFTLRRLAHYYVGMLPTIRRCIGRWDASARVIPSSQLRRDAVDTITRKGTYVEAAAAFAALAAPASRDAAIQFIVAWQVLSDYVDALGEQPSAEPFANNMQLHRALLAAVGPDDPSVDYYAHHPHDDDGGYVAALIATCRAQLRTLPRGASVQPLASVAAQRCREGQSHVHAIGRSGASDGLRRWADAQAGTCGYTWWEIAAAGISGIAIPPLIAAAAGPATTHDDFVAVHDAYWPHVSALSVLLDSVADEDGEPDGFSFLDCYPDGAAMTAGLTRTAANASRAVSALSDAPLHQMIVASMIAYYATDNPDSQQARATLRSAYDDLRPATTLIASALRLQRRLHRA